MNKSLPKRNKSAIKPIKVISAKKTLPDIKGMPINEKLLESEIRYRRLFETAKDGILILDFRTGNIVDANPFIVKILDYPLDEILGKKLWQIGLFSNKKESEKAFDELKTNGYIRFEDMPILRRNGEVAEVEFISNVYLENNSKVIQCNIRDITQRKIVERALIESEKKFRSIMENSADAIFIAAHNGRFIYTNKAVTDMLGYSPEEMQQKTIRDLAPKGKKVRYFEFFKEAQEKGKLFTELDLLMRNGNFVPTDVNSVLLPGGFLYISCRDISIRKQSELALTNSELSLKKQNRDYSKLNKEYVFVNEELTNSITHIKHINKDLIAAKVKAEESDHLKSSFLANMSHEIRTPMNAIIGFSEFLLEPGLTEEKTSEFVNIINTNTQKLLSIISDIVDISKIEVDQITIDLELVNINKLMKDLFVTYKKIIDSKKINLLYLPESPNDMSQIITDRNRISQVISNLLNNAIKFTPQGEIEFGYNIKKKFIEFYVRDSGIGIDSEDQKVIFKRFRKVESTNDKLNGGNGLGLAISKALVEKLGGTINVNSEPGEGSIFIFTIPYENADEKNDNSSRTSESEKYNWDDKTILIVEDEVYNHEYIKELISDTNAKILHAWDGKLAVELVKTHPEISLVIMDIKMPIMDGNEAMQIIKKLRPKLPVIAQTAYAYGHDIRTGIEAGFDNYLIKPIDRILFMEVLNIYLSKFRLALA